MAVRSDGPDSFGYVCTVTLTLEMWPWLKVMAHPWVMDNNCVKYKDSGGIEKLTSRVNVEMGPYRHSDLNEGVGVENIVDWPETMMAASSNYRMNVQAADGEMQRNPNHQVVQTRSGASDECPAIGLRKSK